MKTLIILSAFPPHSYGGGAEIAALRLGKWLVSRGHTVGVVTAADKSEPEARGELAYGMHVWRLRFPRPYAFWDQSKAPKWQKPLWYLQDHFDPRNRALMAQVLDEFRPDCVQIHVASGIGYNSLSEIGRRRIPAVCVLHDLSLACVWGVMARKGKVCARQCAKCKIVSAIRFGGLKTIPTLAMCSPSRATLEQLTSLLPLSGPGRDGSIATVIPNGVDLKEFRPEPAARERIGKEFGIPSNGKLLLLAGRNFAHKGLAFVVEALNYLEDDIWLLVAGADDPSPYRALPRGGRGRDRLIFAGLRDDMPALYAAADAFVLPSSSETFSLACMEAMACGTPVFATRVGGIDEYLVDGVNGYGIERDAKDIAGKVGPILRDGKRLAALREGAAATAQNYSWDHVSRRFEALLEEMTRQKPPRSPEANPVVLSGDLRA